MSASTRGLVDVGLRMLWTMAGSSGVAWVTVRAGKYEVTLMYTCPQSDVGANIRVEAGGKSVEGVLTRAHDPAPIPSPDRVPRGEVYEKVWAPLTLGTLALEKGRTQLVVKALTRPGKAVMELKAVRLRRVE